MSLLEVKSVSKHFGGIKALTDVSFHVAQGEILGLIGPNGAGKTTLFNLISGTIMCNQGAIIFQGRDITGLKPHQVCKLGIARTFQVTRPFGKMTCLENVLVPLTEVHGSGARPEREARARQLLDLTGIGDKWSWDAEYLNLIDKKRLEMARGLATNPKLILLDEVLGGLNTLEMSQALNLISSIRDRFKITIVWIEHIMGAIMRLSERILVLDQGRLICKGSPEVVAQDPHVIQAYLGAQDAENKRS
jgi:branched-chain amino acid transport system ATP-binding protein